MGLFFADFVARVCLMVVFCGLQIRGLFVTFSTVLVGFCMLALLLLTCFCSNMNFCATFSFAQILVGNRFRMTVSISTI